MCSASLEELGLGLWLTGFVVLKSGTDKVHAIYVVHQQAVASHCMLVRFFPNLCGQPIEGELHGHILQEGFEV